MSLLFSLMLSCTDFDSGVLAVVVILATLVCAATPDTAGGVAAPSAPKMHDVSPVTPPCCECERAALVELMMMAALIRSFPSRPLASSIYSIVLSKYQYKL